MALRYQKRNEDIPKKQQGDSFMNFLEKHNYEKFTIVGDIGITGNKTHVFSVYAIPLGDDMVIVDHHPICGSQKPSSLIQGIKMEYSLKDITCSKCQKRYKD